MERFARPVRWVGVVVCAGALGYGLAGGFRRDDGNRLDAATLSAFREDLRRELRHEFGKRGPSEIREQQVVAPKEGPKTSSSSVRETTDPGLAWEEEADLDEVRAQRTHQALVEREERFKHEWRDPTWAPEAETRLADAVRSIDERLGRASSRAEIRCAAEQCLARLDVPSEERARVLASDLLPVAGEFGTIMYRVQEADANTERLVLFIGRKGFELDTSALAGIAP